ncbi:ribosomal RNA-processing protein 7 homolog A [Sitodiplosis mosellana]|uniref:ribosomal RNA-processing protein 7 homolog A n=1 Tax=Sitodiplosis mosellana TaxID=263140 RepID=UPI0024449BC3|nr:ribosomal RNA-processing protein 7 homolog A [Sitodiplosis mosellana]
MAVDLKGFKVLNLEFTFNNEKQTRQLFVQKHNVKRTTDDKPLGKTLFIINIPPYINEPQLRSAFSSLGCIDNVFITENTIEHSNEDATSVASQSKYFNNKNDELGFKVAYVVFKLTKSLENALKLSKVKIESNENGSSLLTGIDKWTKQYLDSFIDEKELQAEVDEYMRAFEEREQEEREESKKTEVDEDGWTVVKRKTGGFQQKESILKALEDKIEKGKEKKEFNNFYAFQIRQSKQKHIVSLRKKFAQDKLKIEAMKKARRFKPF